MQTQKVIFSRLALCEIASDEGAAQFIVPKGLLAFRAGLSPRTVQRVFPDLERAGVLAVERNATGLKASSRYTLLAVPATTGHNVSTIGHGVSTIGHGGGSGLSPLYEERKEPKEPIISEGIPLRTIGGTPYAQDEGGPVPRLEKEHKEPKEPNLAPNGASELLGIPAQPIARASKVRRRDPLLEAFVAFDGSNPADATCRS